MAKKKSLKKKSLSRVKAERSSGKAKNARGKIYGTINGSPNYSRKPKGISVDSLSGQRNKQALQKARLKRAIKKAEGK